jgi:hypothetical protein
MNAALAAAALARKLQRSELEVLAAFTAIVGEYAAEQIGRGKAPGLAWRHALNDALDLVRAGVKLKQEKTQRAD